jgi:hypothetical protein
MQRTNLAGDEVVEGLQLMTCALLSARRLPPQEQAGKAGLLTGYFRRCVRAAQKASIVGGKFVEQPSVNEFQAPKLALAHRLNAFLACEQSY